MIADPRLVVPSDKWERAATIRKFLRDVRIAGHVASATCSGFVGVGHDPQVVVDKTWPAGHGSMRVLLDRTTGKSACDCGSASPCEHALALAEEVGLEILEPDCAIITLDPDNPGLLRIRRTRGELPPAALEALRWLWWKDNAGEVRTLAQAVQHLEGLGLVPQNEGETTRPSGRVGIDVRANGPPGQVRALFRQKALGERVTVRLLDCASDASLALAKLLADRGAHPFPGQLPAEVWSVDEVGFAAFFLMAWERGAGVRFDATLNPRPLDGIDVQLDVGCLPARLFGNMLPTIHDALVTVLGTEPILDAANGHVLIPATRIVAVEDALRALGADVTYKRLAPPRERYLEWPEELPEDLIGARPRLRASFSGNLEENVPNLRENVTLEDYQKQAVAFIRHHEHTCLLADDMGLGKTLEAIAAAMFLEGRILVVCPASAREVWHREVEKFTTTTVRVIGPGNNVTEHETRFVVTGYSNLESNADSINPKDFELVILDESHYVKNAASGRARLVKDRLASIPRRLVISGTPVMNSPDEIRSQLAFLHPEEWSDAQWFRKRFEEPFEEGSDEVRGVVLKRLRQFLEGVMIRREKREALPDLPSKTIEWHRAKLTGEARRAYVALEDDFATCANAEGIAQAAGKLERLKQAALAGKMPAAVKFVRDLLARGDKVVIFSKYRDAIKSVAEELKDANPVTLTGDSSGEERADAEKRFQEDASCRVFVGQLIAAGTALTLTAGTHAVFLDLDWNPANHRQAMDRIHRRGQTRAVIAHFFLAEETVDEDIAIVLDQKGRMMDELLLPTGAGASGLRGAKRLVGERLLQRRAK